jgi:hypothetical protein
MANIKRLLCLAGSTMFLFLSSTVFAQTPADLELSNPRFKQQMDFNFAPRLTADESGSENFKSAPRLEKNVYGSKWSSQAEVIAHNTSPKTIKTIYWEYIFFADPSMQRILGRSQTRSTSKLRAGETKKIKGTVQSPLISQYQKALPLRIEYTDGTVWQSPSQNFH